MKGLKNLIPCLLIMAFLLMAGCGGSGSNSSSGESASVPVNTLEAGGKIVDRDSGAVLKDAKIKYPDGKEVACEGGSFKVEVPEGKSDVFTVEAGDYKPTLVSIQITMAKGDIEIPMVSTDNDEVPLVISVYDKEVKMPGNQKRTGEK